MLQARGVECEWGASARLESYYASLHHSVLGEAGRPSLEFRRKTYDGACGDLMDGKTKECRRKLARIIAKLERRASEKAVHELEDMQFDGESLLRSGADPAFGREFLEAVASFRSESDLTDHPVDLARELLAEADNG